MKKIILTLCCSLMLLPLVAQNIIRPKIAGPNGLWVNSYNGVLFFGRTDFEAQNSAMPMELRFYYNSSSNNRNYGFGNGFSLGYEMRYEVEDNGDVKIIQGDGRSDVFKKFGDEFEAPAGVFSTLAADGNGYVITEKTGEKYHFADAVHKKVTSQEDRFGNRTELTYQNNLLIQIKDAVGHTINLEYTDTLMTKATATFLKGSFSYQYDVKGRLRKITDAMGYTTLYDYDRENRLDEITDANGNKTNISYNNAGMASRLTTAVSDKSIRYDGDKTVFIDYTDPQNQYSYYRWDGKGRVVEKVGLCCGSQATLEYDEDDNVIKRIDANGGISAYTYDDRGNMLSATDPMGYTERYTYDSTFNQVLTYQDKNGNSYSFSYDSKGNLTNISGPEGFSNRFTYNDKGWQITSTDANGNVTSNTYNNDGTISQTRDAAGNVTKYGYDSYGNLNSVTDARNNTSSYAYDALGRVTSQTDALGGMTTLSYDKVGNIVRVKDALNHITAYTYDAVGNVLTKTDAAGNVYTLTYDGKGNVISVKNPLGQIQTMTYNDRNKLTSITNAAGETTSYDYDVKGNLMSISLPNGNNIAYWYDEIDRVISIDDNLGTIAEYTYDANGNQLTVADGSERTVTYTYDALNRKVSETLPSSSKTTYVYDNNSNLLSVTDALGHATQYTYNSLNQQLSHIDALNAKTTFEYDAVGNLVKATDANGNPTTWTYDALNRNTHITFADGLSRQYGYDAVGNMTSNIDRAGNKFTYAYNPVGYMLSKNYPDKTQDTFTYDAIGQMLSAINNDATVTFVYDAAGRLTRETLNGKSTSYSYDIAGGKRTLTYPSGMKVFENLNARGLITSIMQNGEEVVTMAYDESGRKSSMSYANGITTNYSYNDNGWLSQIASNESIINLAFTYDAVGNITKSANLIDDSKSEIYGYDTISQLTSFKRGTTVDNTYQFDPLGNRLKVIENGVVTNYTSNRINGYSSISGGISFTPQYDANGNLLNDQDYQYKYNLNNKLSGVDVNLATYAYDALGRRISKTTSSATTLFYYVGDQMVEEYTGNKLTASYLYGNGIDEALQLKRDSNIYYYHTNQLGSTMTLTDKDGKITERIVYDAYGKPTFFNTTGTEILQSTVGNNILFTGREYDAETGTYYFRARTMHLGIGRFVEKDPLVYIDGMNVYTYVFNEPITSYDPYGLFDFKIPDWGNSGRGNMNSNTGGRFADPDGNASGRNLSNWNKSNLGDTFNGKPISEPKIPKTTNKTNLGKLIDHLMKNPKLRNRLLKKLGKQIMKRNPVASLTQLGLFGLFYIGWNSAFGAETANDMAKDYLHEELIEPWEDLYNEWKNLDDNQNGTCESDDPPCHYNSNTGTFECSISK